MIIILDSAGDAAHSFPPTGGLGLNSGLGDVHNLAYKLAAINQGWGGEKLLDTYEADRRQVALVNSQQSVKNGKKIFELLKTLGTTDADVIKAKENLRRRICDPESRLDIMKGVEGQREHFDNLGLHIGYVYGDKEIPASASLYVPSYRSGARLPHAWLSGKPSHLDVPQSLPIDCSYVSEFSREEIKSKEYSTLDLCSFDAFTVLVDTQYVERWKETLVLVKKQLPMKAATLLRLNLVVMGKDFELQPGARSKAWVIGLQLQQGTAVLIRPDQHILKIYGKNTSAGEVSKGLVQHLGL